MTNAVLLINTASTLFMVGLIWFVQVVHYPLFAMVGEVGFPNYSLRHQRLTTFVVGPPMLIEITTAVLLVWFKPTGVDVSWPVLGLILLGIIWGSTAVLQVPQHRTLSRGFCSRAHSVLVATNWIRTIAWSLRGGLMIWMVTKAIG